MQSKTFEREKPCKKCGTHTRYKTDGRCVACRQAYKRKWTDENRDVVNSASREYRERNKLEVNKRSCTWYKNNRGKATAKCAKYRATKLQRTPSWADLDAIKEFYKNCPAGYHVDHVVPLLGERVSGLHVLENLQYLPAAENSSKGNNFVI